MTESFKKTLRTVDEGLFHRLMAGPGRVQIEIVAIGQYFLPFVTFRAGIDAPVIHYGLILHNGSDLLAAETAFDLIGLLRDMSGGCASLRINWRGRSAPFPQGFFQKPPHGRFLHGRDIQAHARRRQLAR